MLLGDAARCVIWMGEQGCVVVLQVPSRGWFKDPAAYPNGLMLCVRGVVHRGGSGRGHRCVHMSGLGSRGGVWVKLN